MACPGSLLPIDGNGDHPDSPDAREGRALHEAAAMHLRGDEIDAAALAAKHGLSPDATGEIERIPGLVDRQIDEITELLGPIEAVMVETSARMDLVRSPDEDGLAVSMSGTPDLVMYFQTGAIAVVDWKMGRSGDEHPQQLRCYGAHRILV